MENVESILKRLGDVHVRLNATTEAARQLRRELEAIEAEVVDIGRGSVRLEVVAGGLLGAIDDLTAATQQISRAQDRALRYSLRL